MKATFEQLFRSPEGYNEGHQEVFQRKLYKAAGGDLSETTKDQLDGVLTGEYDIKFVERVQKMFDQHGRRIPPQGMKATVVDADRGFYVNQPVIDHAVRLARMTKYLAKGEAFMSPEDFKTRADAILAVLAGDKRTVNISQGVCLPIPLPKMNVTAKTYGKVLDTQILPAVEAAYLEQFPERTFKNWRKGDLAGKVTIVKGSRHENFLDAINDGPVVMAFFPMALQGYSIEADLEQMEDLPEPLLLAGAIEPATGLIGYTAEMARDFQTPGYDAGAVRWSAEGSLIFKARDGFLGFGGRRLSAHDGYSGGIVALG